jgi:hypothetical protein
MIFPFMLYILFAPHLLVTQNKRLSKERQLACPLSHSMEPLVMVRFFILKGLSPRDIHNELESVYMDEAVCLSTVCKWHKRLMQEGTELFVDPRSGRSLENDLADVLRAMIQKFPFTHANFFVCTSDSEWPLDCASYMVFCVSKSSIYDRFRTLSATFKELNRCRFQKTF